MRSCCTTACTRLWVCVRSVGRVVPFLRQRREILEKQPRSIQSCGRMIRGEMNTTWRPNSTWAFKCFISIKHIHHSLALRTIGHETHCLSALAPIVGLGYIIKVQRFLLSNLGGARKGTEYIYTIWNGLTKDGGLNFLIVLKVKTLYWTTD